MVSVKKSDSYNLNFNGLRRTLKRSRRLAESGDEISSRLIVNRTALKVRSAEIGAWIERFRAAVGQVQKAAE